MTLFFVVVAVGVLVWLQSKIPTQVVAALITSLFVYGTYIDDNSVRYYDAWLGTNMDPSRLFNWLAEQRPKRIVAAQLGSGSISVVLPQAFIANASDDPCAEAGRLRAVLVVAGPPYRDCGRKRFADSSATVYRAGSYPGMRTSRPRDALCAAGRSPGPVYCQFCTKTRGPQCARRPRACKPISMTASHRPPRHRCSRAKAAPDSRCVRSRL